MSYEEWIAEVKSLANMSTLHPADETAMRWYFENKHTANFAAKTLISLTEYSRVDGAVKQLFQKEAARAAKRG